MKQPINIWVAILLTFVALMVAGGLNDLFVLKYIGNLGGVIVDILLIWVITEVWRRTRKPKEQKEKPKQSD